jgi:hypothetical protein
MEEGAVAVPLLSEPDMGYPSAAVADAVPRPRVRPAASVPNDEPPPRLRFRVGVVEMAPRPKLCAGNAAAAAAAGAAAGAPLLFLFAEASLLFLTEALSIAAAKGWDARLRKKIGALWLLHR